MNHVYKVVFNKSAQSCVAVCEYARGSSRSNVSTGSKASVRGVVSSITALSFAVLCSLQSAYANTPTVILADTTASKNNQPIVLPTASGITSVNIVTPNDKGLSNNHYRVFDVGNSGVVLNNNRKAVNTGLAGYVQANPFMARGEATTILNQINANNPSYLNGFVEVAGQKADVIIANPSGLVINGAGFINAGNVHLAAANSEVKQGQVAGYQVNTGNIEVNGKLNLQSTDYAALIAKTAQINSEIYGGNTLNVITGENAVTLQDGDFKQLTTTNKQSQQSTQSQNNQQGVALDIAAVGGIYAGKIHLIGTDKGLGVNNAGVLQATGQGNAGGLTLDGQGNLVNTGNIAAVDKVAINVHNNNINNSNDGIITSEQADITINTNELNNKGTIQGTQTTGITATGTIDNAGTLQSGVLQLQSKALDNTGAIIQTGTGNLDITTKALNNQDKAVVGQDFYATNNANTNTGTNTATTPNTGTTTPTSPNNSQANSTNAGSTVAATNTPSVSIPSTNGYIKADNAINNTGGSYTTSAKILANGEITITADKTSNTNKSSIDVATLNTKSVTNTDSKIALDNIDWQLDSFDNSKGDLTARDDMTIVSQSGIVNTEGKLASGGAIQLNAQGKLDNTNGVIQSGGNLTTASSDVLNNKGLITSNKQAALTVANALDNNQGQILGNQSVVIDTKGFNNKGEISAKSITVQAQSNINHTKDDTLKAENLTLKTKGNITNSDKLTVGTELNLQAVRIDNANNATISAPKATINADSTVNNKGLIHADNLAINTGIVENLGARIYGGEVVITADKLLNQGGNKGAIIAAQKDLTLAVDTLTNTHGDTIHKEATDNAWILSQGTLSVHGKDGKDSKTNQLTNLGSRIESAGDMVLSVKNVANTNAHFASEIQKVEGSDKYKEYIIPEHSSTKIDMSSLEWRPWSRANYLTYKGAGNTSVSLDNLGKAPIASVYGCQNPDDESSCGVNYEPNSPVWSYFNIKAPTPMPVIDKALEEPKLPKDETEESCAKADATNTACTAYNKALADYNTALKPLIDWEEANKPQLDKLDEAIEKYNAGFGSVQIKNFTIFKVTEHQEQSVVTDSAPAQIIAGGNLSFDSDTIINDKSQIVAGGKISFDSKTLQNIDAKGKHHTIENGTAQYTRSRWRGGFKRYHQRDWGDEAPFSTAKKKTITLPVTAWQENVSSETLASYGQTKPNTGTITNGVDLTNQPNNAVASSSKITLPNSALYTINTDDPNLPVVQTDPAFTNYKQWLTSEHMLEALQSDPNHIHKRMYDGFVELQVVQNSYYQLTGRQITTDYSSAEAGYKALMDSGITFAKKYQLTPGVALGPEQMANLTTDIVWMVKRTAVIPSKDTYGNPIDITYEALVPTVYLRSSTANTGTLTKDGRLSGISGKDIDLRVKNNLDNDANLIVKDAVSVQAENITNKGVIAGDFVSLKANKDIVNNKQIHANSALDITAGNDFINESLTSSNEQPLEAPANDSGIAGMLRAKGKTAPSSSSNKVIDQVASVTVGNGVQGATDANGKPPVTLSVQAGNLIVYKSALSDNAGDGTSQYIAKNGIELDAITETRKVHAIGDSNNYFKEEQSTDIGSSVTGVGNVVLATTGGQADITSKAANINSSQGTTAIVSAGNVTFSEGREVNSIETANKMSSRNLVSKKTEQNFYKEYSDTSIQSQIGGNQVFIQSGGDTTLTDTKILADKDVIVQTDGKLVIDAAQNTHIVEQQNSVRKSGLVAVSTNGITIGKQATDGKNRSETQYHTGSTLAALDGNVTLSVGESYQQIGSSVQAYVSSPQPVNQSRSANNQSGNIDITAQTVDIVNATDNQTTNSDYKFKQSGVSVTISNPVLDFARNSHEIYQTARKANDSRSYQLAALAIVGDGYKLKSDRAELKNPPKQLGNADPNNPQHSHDIAKDFKIAVSVGSQSNESHSASYRETNKGSELKANNISITATGEKNGDINIVGSQARANNNLLLSANNDINVLSSMQEQHSQSTNKNKSASVGVDFSVGANTGFGVTASGSIGRGNANSTGQTHTNSHITAGNTLVTSSGNDTNIKGAVVKADQLLMDVGGDFNLHSQQDSYNSDAKHRQYGGSISAGIKTAPVSGSINIGMDDSSVNYRGVQEQTTLQIGKGGFNINVEGKTDMRGSVISSEADKSKNQLITGSFDYEDITNISEAKAKTRSYGVDSSITSGNLYPIAKTVIANALGSTGDNHYDTSQTISAIADGTLIAKDSESQHRLDTITNDTTDTHRVIAPANIDEMLADAKARQFLKDATMDTIFKYSDETHKKMFIEQAPIYKIEVTQEANAETGAERQIVYHPVTEAERAELQKQSDGRIHVFTNGIFNGTEAAAKYADQHGSREKDGVQYFVHFPQTNNMISELMVAGYQKYLESNTLGLTNATQQVKTLIKEHGSTGLQMDGHSRGTLTITNAFSSVLKEEDSAGKYTNLRTNMVGAAANINRADAKLATLQGRNDETNNFTEEQKSAMSIQYQGHASDPVHRVIGFNKATGGKFKFGDMVKLTSDATVHNCYGAGNKICDQKKFWGVDDKDNAIIPTWQLIYPIPQKQTQIIQQIQEVEKIKIQGE